jgi:hypothetical protein
LLQQLIAFHEPAVCELRDVVGLFECRGWHFETVR